MTRRDGDSSRGERRRRARAGHGTAPGDAGVGAGAGPGAPPSMPPPPPVIVPNRPVAVSAGLRARPARAELRRQLRQVARLRAMTMVMVVLAIVGAPVAFFVIREAVQDPVFAELDTWGLPDWAATSHKDEAYGSRWCIRECRFRERTWHSSRPADATNHKYIEALQAKGWEQWRDSPCPTQGIQGLYSCWRRDEYVLDLWVRDEPCEIKPVRPQVGASPSAGAQAAAGASPQPDPSGIPGPGCGQSQATVKVFNRIAYQRGG